MADLNDKYWEIICYQEKFDKLRREKYFCALLTLGRICNSMLFCKIPAIESQKNDSPSSMLLRTNSFLYVCSVLYEGLKVADTLGQYFKDMPSFKKGFGDLLRDPKTKKIKNTILKKVRNKTVFHFDSEVAEKGLKNVNLPYYTFVEGYGQSTKEIYFNLSDYSFITYLLSEECADSDFDKCWEGFVCSITELSGKFIKASQLLLEEVLRRTGWSLESV